MDQSSEKTKGWGDKLRELFSTEKSNEVSITLQQAQINSDTRRIGETYEQWGKRICGVVTGSLTALPPYLQKVYNYNYREQADNVQLQQAARINTQAEIDRKNDEIKVIQSKIEDAQSQIDTIHKKIEDLKVEKEEIKRGKERINTEQRLKLVIGLIILFPLTVYLFLFYSSTFYSAFFRDPSSMTTVMNSMFDSNAIYKAYQDGVSEMGFVLSAPIIFLGLGFALHFFSKQKGKVKYLKMAAILLVTFTFDCILAYKIGEQLHTFGIIIGQYPIGEVYTLTMATHDINTWAVIFCGFIVYIIWGIVFDMCMDAFSNMDLNKTRLDNIKTEIENFEQSIQSIKNDINTLRQQDNEERKEITSLMGKLGHEVYIDYAAIRTEMNNFFAGWITMMQVLSFSKIEQNKASDICKQQIATLIPE